MTDTASDAVISPRVSAIALHLPVSPRRAPGVAVHGLLGNLVHRYAPQHFEHFHGEDAPRPYSLSVHPAIAPGCIIRLGLLTDEMHDAIRCIRAGAEASEHYESLDGQAFLLRHLRTTALRGWTAQSSYRGLLQRADTDNVVTLRFETGSQFPRPFDGKLALLYGLTLRDPVALLPAPALVFTGLARVWRHFAPVDLQMDGLQEFVQTCVHVSHFDLRSAAQPWRTTDHGEVTWAKVVTGRCEYAIHSKDRGRIRQVQTLAAYAFYTGTGKYTTQGMGLTRQVSSR